MHIPVSMHTGSWCENKPQSGVTSDKCLLCAGDTHFETLMKFFLFLLFGSPSAQLLQLQSSLSSSLFLPLNLIYFTFLFFSPPLLFFLSYSRQREARGTPCLNVL